MIAQETIDEIKARASLADVVREVVALKRQGSSQVGLCPFHSEKSPSFHVRDDESYHCFGCGVSGNVITFIKESRGLSFPDAVEELANRLGITVRYVGGKGPREQPKGDRDALYRINKGVVAFFRHSLERAPNNVREYIASRGLTPELLDIFGIGYAPHSWDSLSKFLKGKGVGDEALLQSGVARRSPRGDIYDLFRARLIFPIWHDNRRISAFGGRIIPGILTPEETERAPKYINSPETIVYQKNKTFYGLPQAINAIRDEGAVYLVEGYMDVVSLYGAGVHNVIATCGTAVTEQHVRRLSQLSPRVTVLFDGDSAGRAAAGKCFPLFLNSGIDASALFLPVEDDPDTIARRLGSQTPEYLNGLPRNTLFDCYVDSILLKYGGGEQGGIGAAVKGKIASEVGELVRRVENPVEKGILLERLSHRLMLPEGGLAELVNQKQSEVVKAPLALKGGDVRPAQIPISSLPRADQELLTCAIARKELAQVILADKEISRSIAEVTLQFIHELDEIRSSSLPEEDKKMKIKAILHELGDSWVAHWRNAYKMAEDKGTNIGTVFEESVRMLKKSKLKQQLSEYQRIVLSLSDPGEKDLLSQKIYHLSKELQGV